MNNQKNPLSSTQQSTQSYFMLSRMSKQTGGVSQLLLMLLIGGLGYFAFTTKNQGVVSFDKAQSFVGTLSDKISFSIDANSDRFSGYGVQLMATKQLNQAESVMNDFARDGYSAFVLSSEAKGRTVYKVRLGPYSHKSEAVAIKDNVTRRYLHNPYVKSSLVIYRPH